MDKTAAHSASSGEFEICICLRKMFVVGFDCNGFIIDIFSPTIIGILSVFHWLK
jgi:hypothetical protein